MRIKVLLVGCGDIALRLASQLNPARYHCIGLRRRIDQLPATIEGLAWDLDRPAGLAERLPSDLEVALITLVPRERTEAAYHQSYVKNLRAVLEALQQQVRPPRLVLFASSTSVYGQDNGEWVDEDSRTEAKAFNGQQLLEAEALLRESALATCAVRFSGIYGPGRERLLQQVAAGKLEMETNPWTNRIHSEDCAATLAFLIEQANSENSEGALPNTTSLPDTLIATDNLPCPYTDVSYWLASQQDIAPPKRSQAVEGGKRCSNQRLLKMGFKFRYPSFREGYGELLKARGSKS